jgi:CorA-like Mg2+ transporter protein
MGQLIAAAAYSGGRRVADISIEEGRRWSQQPDYFVWIGFHEPTEPELREIQAQFELHPLAIEDALHAHQRPKLELYGDSLFLVLRTAQLQGDHVTFGETHIFAGQGFVISIRHGPSASYAPVRARCESCPRLLRHGEDYVLHAILDFVVDNYLPVVEAAGSGPYASWGQHECDEAPNLAPDRGRLLEAGDGFGRPPAMLPIRSPAALQTLGRAWPGTRAAVHPAAAIRHGGTTTGGSASRAGAASGHFSCYLKCLPPAGRMRFIGLVHSSPSRLAPRRSC